MKRLALTIATLLFAFAGVNAQYKMVVETNDGLFTSFCITDIKSITWQYSDPEEPGNNYEYVDLGLSVKWATCNVGATTPEEYGDYFAWGETVGDPYVAGKTGGYTKSFYWSTYKYCEGSDTTMTKYCNNSSYGYNGFTDGKTTLELSDDAARANWGGKWRMPTRAEFNELLNSSNCTWTWTTQNGVNGYKVVSKKPGYEGNCIFLPAAGYRSGTDLDYTGSRGYYWSSSHYENRASYRALLFEFYSLDRDADRIGSRCCGYSVRPVIEERVSSISLNKTAISLMEGSSEILTVTVTPWNAGNKNVTWSSSDTGVATVDQNGKVTAIKEGTATITVKTQDGGYTATCTVTVKGASSGNYENGHGYVDLGLSVKWATCNVGAFSPEEYGSYFAWGETSPKHEYSWSTYKYCKGSLTTMTKYCTNSSYGYNGFTDGKTTPELSDDAACAIWGGSWRMPTRAEFDELSNSDNCSWTWTTQNGVNGYKVVSKKPGYEGNCIFLPAAGYRDLASLSNAGSYGFYWSSSLSENVNYCARFINFYSGGHYSSSDDRYYGRSVRPVCQ